MMGNKPGFAMLCRKALYASSAFALAVASMQTALAAAGDPAAPFSLEPTHALGASNSDDSAFLQDLRSQMRAATSEVQALASRAKQERPHLSAEINDLLEDLDPETPEGATTSSSSGSSAASKAAAPSGISTNGIVIGGGVALALAGGTTAVLLSGGQEETKANTDPKNPIYPYEPPPPPGLGPGPKGPRDAFETPEYFRARHLESIGASKLHAAGYTGEGIKVAMIGTGMDIDHPEFEGRILNPYNAVTDRDSVSYRSVRGTHIAGLIGAAKDGVGMHGVAYDATLIPISLSDRVTEEAYNPGATGEYLARAVDHAVANEADVISNAYTMDASALPSITESTLRMFLPELMSSLDKAIENDIVMVFQTGNDGADEPDLPAALPKYVPGTQGNWIAVASLNPHDEARSSFSNRCGSAAEWCLYAPGTELYSTMPRDSYEELSRDTSRAAAVVAGGVALLRQVFPYMEAHEIAALLFESADKVGSPEIYGQGVMNLERAFQPVGEVAVPEGSTVDGKRTSLSGSSLQLSPAFGDGVAGALEGQQLMGLDKYDRGFQFDLSDLLAPNRRDSRRDALHRLKLFGGLEERSIKTVEAGPFSITTATRLRASDPSMGQTGYARMSFGFAAEGYELEASINPDMGRSFGLREVGFGSAPMMDASSFDQPHLALMENGFGSSLRFGLTPDSDLRVAGFSGNIAVEDNSPFTNAPSLFGGVGEITTDLSEGLTVKAAVGAVSEEGSLLGSVSRGAFGERMRSNTLFANLGGSIDLAPNVKLSVSGSLGQSSFKQNGGMIRSGDGIVTSSLGVGLSQAGLFQDEDVLSLVASQPLRVESGTVELSVPTARNMDGSIGYRQMSLNTQPSGREINLQASYGFKPMAGIETSVGAMHRFDANHVRGQQETIGMLAVSFSF